MRCQEKSASLLHFFLKRLKILEYMKMPPEFRKYLAEIGRKGGKKGGIVTAQKMTAEQRAERARKAVAARERKRAEREG
jgi:hypothetical protein